VADELLEPDVALRLPLATALPNTVKLLLAQDSDTPLAGDQIVIITPLPGVPFRNTNGALRGGAWVVALAVLARSQAAAARLSEDVFAAVIDLEQRTVPGAGFISSVDVEQLPTRAAVNKLPNTKVFEQINMQFTVRLRPTAD
jgi:hypothetical protein